MAPGLRISRLATAGLALAAAYTGAGVAAAPFNPEIHMTLMALGAATLFPYSLCATAFIGALGGGGPRKGAEALTLATGFLAASAAPVAGVLNLALGLTLALLALSTGLLFAYLEVRRSLRREPRIIFYYPFISGIVALTYVILEAPGPLESLLILGLSFPVPLIFSFGLLAMTRNYGVGVSRLRVYAPLSLHGSYLALLVAGREEAYILSAASMILYFPSIGVQRARGLVERARASRSPAVRRALVYIVSGHLLALTASIMALSYSLALRLGLGDPVAYVHLVYMGFIGIHIYTHAPLMAPHIMGVKVARRYNPAPQALLFAAAVLRPIHSGASYWLLVLSLASLILVMKPLSPLTRFDKPRGKMEGVWGG